MRPLRDLSINTKLSLLVTMSVVVALSLVCVAFLVSAYSTIRSAKVEQLSSMAEALGSSSTTALALGDPKAAEEALSALRVYPTIAFAVIYDLEGNTFAKYGNTQGPGDELQIPEAGQYVITDEGHLNVVHAIRREGEPLGTILLHSNLDEVWGQITSQIQILAIVMIVSLLVVVVISSRLQRLISQPILQLAGTAQQITASRDYSIRIEKSGNDEIGTLHENFDRMLDEIQRGEQELQRAADQLERHVEERTGQLSQTNLDLEREVAERARAEEALETVHGQLVEAARKAGMAEIATGVLHNVGNVLNSINVSSTLVAEQLRGSQLFGLQRAVELIHDHLDDLQTFLTQHEQGIQLPRFLTLLAEHLSEERSEVLEELEVLAKNVDHVKTIVAMQQSYAGVSNIMETVDLSELVEDAFRLNAASFGKSGIHIIRQHEAMPAVDVEKPKLLQILVNLITNARDSLVASEKPEKTLTVRTSRTDHDTVRIDIMDNGVGIPSENLTRIFSHGFTTKKHGHGFGLHSSANAAKEMGGSLTAKSDGLDQGATFSVELPCAQNEDSMREAIGSGSGGAIAKSEP